MNCHRWRRMRSFKRRTGFAVETAIFSRSHQVLRPNQSMACATIFGNETRGWEGWDEGPPTRGRLLLAVIALAPGFPHIYARVKLVQETV